LGVEVSPLVGFKSSNHPQQLAIRGVRADIDDRGTDPELFQRLDARFHFTVDVAAAKHNAKCQRYYTIEQNGLAQSWGGERVWCNPPFSDIEPWVRKAWDESMRSALIVMLLPANRTEQGWWQDLVEPNRDRGRIATRDAPFQVEFLPGRPRFILYGRGYEKIEANQRPPFGICIAIWANL
jgi:phage N-6-adenine-methyltransferase